MLRCVNWTLGLSWFKQSRCFPAVSGPWPISQDGACLLSPCQHSTLNTLNTLHSLPPISFTLLIRMRALKEMFIRHRVFSRGKNSDSLISTKVYNLLSVLVNLVCLPSISYWMKGLWVRIWHLLKLKQIQRASYQKIRVSKPFIESLQWSSLSTNS